MEVPNLELNLLESHEDIPEFLAWLADALNSGRTLSIDTETASAKEQWLPEIPYGGRGHCRLWQVGHSEGGWAIPSQDWHALVGHAMQQIVGASNTIVFANVGYDQREFAKEGWPTIPWHRIEDVIPLHRLIRSHMQDHGLKPAAAAELGDWATAGQDELKRVFQEEGYTWETVPTDHPVYWQYGVFDTCLTVLLWEAIAKERTLWYDVEMEYIRIMHGAEARGLRVDEAAVNYAHDVWTSEIDEAAARLAELGMHKPTSDNSVMAAFEALGFEPEDFSKTTGNPSYKKAVLDVMKSIPGPIGEMAELLMDHRTASAWRNNYGRKLLDFIDSNGLIHPNIQTMKARTLRSSITDPPLQTIPKKPITRDMFIPRRPRHKLWAIDYNSQEIRIMAALSGDKAMIAFFEGDDDDYHSYVANLAGIPRPAAKIVNYARAYGASPDTLARGAKVPTEEMLQYLQQIDDAFPRAMRWKDEITRMAENRSRVDGFPWVELPYGRWAALDEGREFTQAANTVIQGHGADMLKLASVRIASAGYEEAIVLPVHDELLLEFPQGEGEHYAPIVGKIMEDNLLTVPMTTEVTGPLDRWGDAYRKEG